MRCLRTRRELWVGLTPDGFRYAKIAAQFDKVPTAELANAHEQEIPSFCSEKVEHELHKRGVASAYGDLAPNQAAQKLLTRFRGAMNAKQASLVVDLAACRYLKKESVGQLRVETLVESRSLAAGTPSW